jgi:hypothetical protein
MVATLVFAMTASGVTACFIQAMKYSESNLAQSYAQQVAQSIIEQVISVPPALLFDSTQANIEITLPSLNASNRTSMPGVNIPWAANSTTFTEIGPSSQGVLTDAAYLYATNVIRPERYLRMQVNLERTLEPVENRMKIVLRYKWARPERKGTPTFLNGEIRTIRSTALRF